MKLLIVVVVLTFTFNPAEVSAKRCLKDLATLYRLYNPTNGDHFYTTSLDEANNAINNLGYKFELSPGLVSTSSSDCECGKSFAPVYRLYKHGDRADHFYTLNETEANRAATDLGYKREGIAFYCVNSLIHDCDASLSLHRYWRGTDHFYTSDKDEGNRNVVALGGKYEGIMCGIWPADTTANNCQLSLNNLAPLHRLYHPEILDHLYTVSDREADNAATSLGYVREMSPGLVAKSPCGCECGAIFQRIYRLYKRSEAAGQGRRDDHFYTTNSTEAGDAERKLGYKREGTAYYCSLIEGKCGAILALHRYFRLGSDHFYTTDLSEGQKVVTSGEGVYEGIMCYIWPTL